MRIRRKLISTMLEIFFRNIKIIIITKKNRFADRKIYQEPDSMNVKIKTAVSHVKIKRV